MEAHLQPWKRATKCRSGNASAAQPDTLLDRTFHIRHGLSYFHPAGKQTFLIRRRWVMALVNFIQDIVRNLSSPVQRGPQRH